MSETTVDVTTDDTKSDGGGDGYNPPATQEELNKIIQSRVGRVEAKYADYDDLKSAAAKLAEIEAANQSKEEKLLKELEAAQKAIAERDEKLTQAELRSLRSEIAREKNVPAAHLSGFGTREEMEAAADELIAWRDANKKPTAPKRGSLRSGAASAPEDGLSAKERAARALRGE
jgi:superfamily II DNA helicase RecQ